MLQGALTVFVLAGGLALFAQLKKPEIHRPALSSAMQMFKQVMLRMPPMLFALGMLAKLLPEGFIAAQLGANAGLQGIFLGTLFGALLPGGPIVTFPVIVILMEDGAAGGPLIALLTAWSLVGLHRVMSFEFPLMGARFVAIRLIASSLLPALAGLLAAAIYGVM